MSELDGNGSTNKLTDIEIYCIAKLLQSALFSGHFTENEETNIFYGCKHCKYQRECMPDKKPHSDMVIDRMRKKLQDITAVNLDYFVEKDKFIDIHQS